MKSELDSRAKKWLKCEICRSILVASVILELIVSLVYLSLVSIFDIVPRGSMPKACSLFYFIFASSVLGLRTGSLLDQEIIPVPVPVRPRSRSTHWTGGPGL